MGSVYVLSSPDGYYKIGCSSGFAGDRINQFAPKLPFKTELKHCFMCALGSQRRAESLLHERFASKRENGEWFRLDSNDLEWLYQLVLPLPIAISHMQSYDQENLSVADDAFLFENMLGLS